MSLILFLNAENLKH